MVDERAPMPSPEDAVVIAETLRLLVLAVGGISVRADGNINHRGLYDALVREHERAAALVSK